MRIRDVKMTTVEIPLLSIKDGGIAPYVGSRDYQAGTAAGTTYALSNIFKVETDEGINGWGEMNPVISLDVNRRFLEEFIKPFLIGQDPFQIRQVLERFSGVYHPQIYGKTFLTGVEMACWDIKGKAAGRSVCDLLGGKVRDRAKIAYCLGMLGMEETRDKLLQIKESGFLCVKAKGGNDVNADIHRTRLLRETAGEDFELRMDVNQSYDVITAVKYLNGVEDCGLQYIEQPLPINRFSEMNMLRNKVRVPLAINEDCYMPGNFMEFVRRDAIDAAVVDMEQLGGIGEMVKLGTVAEQAGIPMAHHCGFDMGIKTAAILQAGCACPSFSYAMDSTYHSHADDILANRIRMEKGCYILPEGHGLGIEVDEDKLAHYSIEHCNRRFL